MKKMNLIIMIVMLAVIFLSTCKNTFQKSESEQDAQNTISSTNTQADKIDKESASFPQELKEIPKEYYSSAEEAGTLVELYYNTYESMSYEQKTQQLEKRAIVYLPMAIVRNRNIMFFILCMAAGVMKPQILELWTIHPT